MISGMEIKVILENHVPERMHQWCKGSGRVVSLYSVLNGVPDGTPNGTMYGVCPVCNVS